MTSSPPVAASEAVLGIRLELKQGMRRIALLELGERTVEVMAGSDSLWAIIRRGGKAGSGGLAMRLAHCAGGIAAVRKQRKPKGALLALAVDGAVGVQHLVLQSNRRDLETLRVTNVLTPAEALLIPFYPRDIYPLGPGDDPLCAVGKVEAAQRGMNSGLSYFHLDEPAFGSVLYFQNLTALNDYFKATETSRMGR